MKMKMEMKYWTDMNDTLTHRDNFFCCFHSFQSWLLLRALGSNCFLDIVALASLLPVGCLCICAVCFWWLSDLYSTVFYWRSVELDLEMLYCSAFGGRLPFEILNFAS